MLDDDSAGVAVLAIRRRINSSDGWAQSAPKLRIARIQLGHYDPVRGWQLYPELFQAGEAECASEAIQAMEERERWRLRQSVAQGRRFVDLHHELTVEARAKVADFLITPDADGSSLSSRLLERHAADSASRFRSADSMTSVWARSVGVDNPNRFSIVYQGLVLNRDPHNQQVQDYPSPGTLRDEHEILITAPGLSSWSFPEICSQIHHRRDTHGEADHQRFAAVSKLLFAYASEHPDFSPAACAVAYNDWNGPR